MEVEVEKVKNPLTGKKRVENSPQAASHPCFNSIFFISIFFISISYQYIIIKITNIRMFIVEVNHRSIFDNKSLIIQFLSIYYL